MTGGVAVTGQSYTWTDSSGDQYEFVPAAAGSPDGTLTISKGLFGAPGNEIVVDSFNLSQAEFAAGGYMGISLAPSITLSASGAEAGQSQTAPNFQAGTSQAYTISLNTPAETTQTVTITLTGAPASDFGVASGSNVVPLSSSGTFTLTLPAGATSATFSLVNTGDVGAAAPSSAVGAVSP